MSEVACVASIGNIYEIEKLPWTVDSMGNGEVRLRCLTKDLPATYGYREFNRGIQEGIIKIPRRAENGVAETNMPFADLCEEAKLAAYQRRDYINRYLKLKHKPGITKSHIIKEVAKERGEKPFSVRMLERWIERYESFEGSWRGYVPKKHLNRALKKRTKRIHPLLEALMGECIDDVYLVFEETDKNNTLDDVVKEMRSLVKKRNLPFERGEVPQKATVFRRIRDNYDPIEVVRRRDGPEAAKRMEDVLGVPERPTRILQICEMDETKADVFVVDKHGVPIGRPTIVLMVDVYSKLILSIYVTWREPSAAIILHTIKLAILPKDKLLSGINGIFGDWNAFGIMERIRTDNIRHYLSNGVDEAFLDLDIEQEQSRVEYPQGKSTVERTFGTINVTHLNKMPGYVELLKDRMKKTGLDPQKHAILTLDKFNEHLYQWVVNKYNYKQRDSLGKRTPIDVWNESAELYPPRFDRPLDYLDVSLLLTVKERSLHLKKGVAFKNTYYSNKELMQLRAQLVNAPNGQKTKNPSVKIKWDPDDLGHILVKDPLEDEYIKVECVDKAYIGLTDAMYDCANDLKKYVRKNDGERIDIEEAVHRLEKAFSEESGNKQKISEKKRVARTQAKIDQSIKDASLVASGQDFSDEINGMDSTSVEFDLEGADKEPVFGKTEIIRD